MNLLTNRINGRKHFSLLVSMSLSVMVFFLVMVVSNAALAAKLVVKEGSRGGNVVKVQLRLIEKGFLQGSADGVCGKMTVEAIKKFQKANGLEVDGVCGMVTYRVLDPEDAEKVAAAPEPEHRGYHLPKEEYQLGRSMWVHASAYSAYDPGCGNRTATGTLVRHGEIAVDPAVIPLGTRVYIPGYGEAVAEDIGSSIRGNKIDVAFDSLEEVMQFGRQEIEIFILDQY